MSEFAPSSCWSEGNTALHSGPLPCAGQPRFTTAVQLVGGSSPLSGNVQVLDQGGWREVCASDNWYGSYFDDYGAGVVCRQLGYTGGPALTAATGYGGNRVTSFKLTSFCGPETTLTLSNCPNSVDYTYCFSMAWVTCSTEAGNNLQPFLTAVSSWPHVAQHLLPPAVEVHAHYLSQWRS